MKKITKIGVNETLIQKKKLKVAAYCRVSTASDEQLISLEAQKAHYENYIRSNDEWEYVGLYYDEGITGTKKDVRAGLLSMIADCEDGKIEFIITKSISRFARNTTDCLEMVRKLTDLGIFIFLIFQGCVGKAGFNPVLGCKLQKRMEDVNDQKAEHELIPCNG